MRVRHGPAPSMPRGCKLLEWQVGGHGSEVRSDPADDVSGVAGGCVREGVLPGGGDLRLRRRPQVLLYDLPKPLSDLSDAPETDLVMRSPERRRRMPASPAELRHDVLSGTKGM